MFFWAEQQLYSLPCYETLLFQRRYCRRPVAIICGRRLQAVKCTKRTVDEGNGRGRGVCEQDIIVTTNVLVPGRDLRRSEIWRIAGFEFLALVAYISSRAAEQYAHSQTLSTHDNFSNAL